MVTTTAARQLQLRGTAAELQAQSTFVPQVGEIVVEYDPASPVGKLKVGNGATNLGTLEYVGSDVAVTYATQQEVDEAIRADVSVSPRTVEGAYPRKITGVVDTINAEWNFAGVTNLAGRTTIALLPRSDTLGVNDAINRTALDNRFIDVNIGATPANANKAVLLNASGLIDSQYVDTNNLPGFKGAFDPTTGVPPLINQAGGGVNAQVGDYYLSSASGFYDFATGTPGSGIEILANATVIFRAGNVWEVFNPSGSTLDPGAVRQAPVNTAESTIKIQGTNFPSLVIVQNLNQTGNLTEWKNSSNALLSTVDTTGILTSPSVDVQQSVFDVNKNGSDYPRGVSNGFAQTSTGWPIDGACVTQYLASNNVYQIIYGLSETLVRRWQTTWSAWSVPITITGKIVGEIFMFGGDNLPPNCLWPDGSSLSTATYPDLFAAFGYRFGGSGGDFNLPDIRGRSIFGRADMGGTASGRLNTLPNNGNLVGEAGGAETRALTTAQLPSHNHTSATHNHVTGSHTHSGGSHSHTGPSRNSYGAFGNPGGQLVAVGETYTSTGSSSILTAGSGSLTSNNTTPGPTGSVGNGEVIEFLNPLFIMNLMVYSGPAVT